MMRGHTRISVFSRTNYVRRMGKNTPQGEELFIYFADEDKRNLQLDVPSSIPEAFLFCENIPFL